MGMKMYPKSQYGFCDKCRKTDRAVVFRTRTASSMLCCPTCMDLLSAGDAVSTLVMRNTYCHEMKCTKKSIGQCNQCNCEVCEGHYHGGICVACFFVAKSVSGLGSSHDY